MKKLNKHRFCLYFLHWFAICYTLLILFASITNAQNNVIPSKYDELKTALDETFKTETQNISKLKEQLDQVQNLKKTTLSTIEKIKIQYSIYNNLLLQPETPIKHLEKTLLDIQTSLKDMESRLNELFLKHDELSKLRSQTDDMIGLTQKQFAEIKKKSETEKETATIVTQFKTLIESLRKKRNLLEETFQIYVKLIDIVNENKKQYDNLLEKLRHLVKEKKKQTLLEHKFLFVSIGIKQIHSDAKQIIHQIQSIPTKKFWISEFDFIRTFGDLFLASFILFFLIIQIMVLKVRHHLLRIKDHPVFIDRRWNRLAIIVMQRSFILLGLTTFFYIYLQSGKMQTKPLIIVSCFSILLLWLFTKWMKEALKVYCLYDKPAIPNTLASHFHVLIILLRAFGIFYIFLSWIHSNNSSIIILGRFMFEVCLYTWNIKFWKTCRIHYQSDKTKPSPGRSAIILFLKFSTYIIIIGGFILEVTGYGSLAQYMFVSWGQSAVVVMWGVIIFFVLKEWNPENKNIPSDALEDSHSTASSIRWVVVKLLMLIWFNCLGVLLVLSWDGGQSVLMRIFHVLKQPIQFGSMQFSLLGFIVAFLILLFTHGLSRVWRHIFREAILKLSGIEEGLQDSITTISIYAIWMFGILFALNAVGFNATSLTVALGALGIGLGFGLQNIFNNFISGIILLFERPIQTGDDIELNGIWAKVKKINVRSTVVQTYDNASLIIPNSDLISSQVTNWSFKDKRLRRNIDVGVAYRSDIELVRQTLFEVAKTIPRILRIPKPEVMFIDFGDSALIFRLRIWTRVEYFYSVETDIRFEIDRLFRKRNIEISFPQRDIHIKSPVNNSKKNKNDILPESEVPSNDVV